MTAFVDTSCWYAAADRSDTANAAAKKVLRSIDARVTTDFVLVETWRLLHHRLGWHVAEQFWEGIRSGVAQVEAVTPADLEAAWHMGKAFADQEFSLTDRTSFAVMQRLGIHTAASFDSDFAVFRFGKNNRQSFAVLRA